MARNFTVAASTAYNAAAPIATYPFTISFHFQATDTVTQMDPVFLQNAGESIWAGFILNQSGAGSLSLNVNNVSEDNVDATAAFSANTWTHACGVWSSATSRSIYLNGANKATSVVSKALTSLTQLQVGMQFGGVVNLPLDGKIAELGIWDVVLTDAEVLALSKGASPLMIRPANLVGYWPLLGRTVNEPDYVSTNVLVPTVAGTQTGHVDILNPRLPILGKSTAVIIPTVIRLFQGHANPNTIILRDPTVGDAAGSQNITGTLYTDTDTFFASVVTPGAVTITGALFTDTDTFFTAVVSRGAVTITAALFTDTDTFFASTITTGSVTISGALFSDADTFFTSVVTTGPVTITGALFTDADVFFASTITTTVTIAGALFSETDTFFAATISTVTTITGALFSEADVFFTASIVSDQTLIGALFTDAEIFFNSVLTTTVSISGSLFTDADTFFGATVTPGAATISGALFTDADVFFASTLSTDITINGNLFTDPDVFFGAFVDDGSGGGGGPGKYWFKSKLSFFGG